MKIAREKLIKLYDERASDPGRGSDVSALTALWGEDLILGILRHYWEQIEGVESKILSYSCTTGKKRGHRLDAWVTKDKDEAIYQVEVKNWAAYSFGQRQLKLDCTAEELDRECSVQWRFYFESEEIPGPAVKKVLVPMKQPKGYENHKVIPLLCFWFFIAESINSPYSKRPYSDGREVHVFSASAYLRVLKEPELEISMPRVEKRLRLLFDICRLPNSRS